MEIRPTGAAPMGMAGVPTGPAVAAKTLPSLPIAKDVVATLFSELGSLDTAKLLALLPQESRPDLLDALLNAAAAHDLDRVVDTLGEMTHADPAQAEQMPAHPVMQPFRSEAEAVLQRAVTVARMASESKLAEAENLVSSGHGSAHFQPEEAQPSEVLRLSRMLREAGGLTNYVHSADLSQTLIDALRFVPLPELAPHLEPRPHGTWTSWRTNVSRDRMIWLLPLVAIAVVLLWRC